MLEKKDAFISILLILAVLIFEMSFWLSSFFKSFDVG